ncbi:spinster family MFS transporter [Sphingopyxis kveilinensis]|uniref:spinster family MFS transporter n=1 Tax=Sphingopyxis kveilinensis TaxID=3114367 RepID=UPI0030CF6497
MSSAKDGYKLPRFTIGLLVCIYTFCYIDRQIINILAEPIKNDLSLSDSQLGLMTGIAFAIFYSTMGIPVARLAEKHHRGYIIAASVALWSMFTIACGFAKSFGWMLLARVGVAIGEAGCTPASNSLIIDYTPPEKRARAISWYMLGVPLGLLIGMASGGALADLYGWRTAFVVAGLPGFLLAILAIVSIKDPRRGRTFTANDDAPADVAAPIALIDTLRTLARNRPFVLVAVGGATASFMANGQVAFLAAFLLRVHGPGLETMYDVGPITVVGLTLGLVGGIFGGIGMLAGGWLGDRFGGRNFEGYMTVCALAAALAIPFFVLALLAPSWGWAVAALIPASVLGSVWGGPVFALIPSIVAPNMRATAVAVGLFGINLIGHGAGPLFTGLLSDYFATTHGPSEGLRLALVVSTLVGLAAIPFYLMARSELKRATAAG